MHTRDNMNGHNKLNMGLIFESVLMLSSKIGQKFYPRPLKIQTTKVGVFFETHCENISTSFSIDKYVTDCYLPHSYSI